MNYIVDFDTEPCPECRHRIKPIKKEYSRNAQYVDLYGMMLVQVKKERK